jgi:hypothetical protein
MGRPHTDCRNSLLFACSHPSTSPANEMHSRHERIPRSQEGLTQDSGWRKFGERAELVESLVNQSRRHDALLLCRCCDLQQSLPTEIHWKREFGLMLHHRIENVLQRLRFVSILKVDACAMRLRSGRPVLNRQKPMTSAYGGQELQVIQSATRSDAVFNVNQPVWAPRIKSVQDTTTAYSSIRSRLWLSLVFINPLSGSNCAPPLAHAASCWYARRASSALSK